MNGQLFGRSVPLYMAFFTAALTALIGFKIVDWDFIKLDQVLALLATMLFLITNAHGREIEKNNEKLNGGFSKKIREEVSLALAELDPRADVSGES